jgi:hypothetical protein
LVLLTAFVRADFAGSSGRRADKGSNRKIHAACYARHSARRLPFRTVESRIRKRVVTSRCKCCCPRASISKSASQDEAVTSDDEKDGHQFVVTFMLSANFKAALKDAEPAFPAILSQH